MFSSWNLPFKYKDRVNTFSSDLISLIIKVSFRFKLQKR